MAREICIDLGTSNTVISEKNKGIILCEPTVAAIDNSTGKILAAGTDAKNLFGKTPAEISVICPVKSGVIADFDTAAAMLRTFLTAVIPKGALRPKACVCTPCGITRVEKSTVLEAVERAGAKSNYTVDTPIAAAMGAGLDVSEPSGNMILDIGGGKICASVISFGGIITSSSITDGGDEMDRCIVEYIRKKSGVLIGERTAEKIKLSIGTAYDTLGEKSINITGRNEKNGLPQEITVTEEQVFEAISPVLAKITELVKTVLSHTPAELCEDLRERGMHLCGAGAQLPGLAEFIENTTGFRATVCVDAHLCTALGAQTLCDMGNAR